MEMIDVLKKLEDIASNSPEVAKAIESTEAMNPKDVDENAVQSDKSVSQNDQEVSEEVADKINEYKVGSYKDFLAGKGVDIYKLKGDDHVKYAKMYRDAKEKAHQDAVQHKGTDDHIAPSKNEGGMSDIHIGAQEALGEYMDEDGNLTAPRRDVVAALVKKSKEEPFPASYEYETAARMAADDFDDNGQRKSEMEPAMDSEQVTDEGNAFAQAVQQAKASGMKKGDKFKVGDEEHTLRDSDFEEVNTATMKTEKTQEGKIPAGLKAYQDKKAGKEEKKETVKEAIQISTDSPEEAGIMMKILKLAGVEQVTPDMMGHDHDHDNDGEHDHSPEDHDSEMPMDKMRDMIQQSQEEETTEEDFANSPEEKHQDTEYMLNKLAGGLNKPKQQVRKEYPGDNPLAVEDTVTEQDLANSLRSQYEGFKESYQEATKVAEAKPDFLDMDKDGDKKEPMKKAIKDKEAK
jgi:hypothetical protein